MTKTIEVSTQQWQRERFGPDLSRSVKWLSADMVLVIRAFTKAAKSITDMMSPFVELSKALGLTDGPNEYIRQSDGVWRSTDGGCTYVKEVGNEED